MKFLRRLVTVLTAVMIFGLVAVVGLLVIRLSDSGPALPENLTLPSGKTAEAVTIGTGWIAVVSGDEILIFDANSGALKQTVQIVLED